MSKNKFDFIINSFHYSTRCSISNDEVTVQVKEIFDRKSIPQIVAQLERIYRTCDEFDRRYVASDYLTGLTGVAKENSQTRSVRGFRSNSNDFDKDLTDLAEELLDKLSKIWGNKD